MEFFAAAPKGTEEILKDELKELGLNTLQSPSGGVRFDGGWEEAYRACYLSRLASRVYLQLGSFIAASEDELYEGVKAVDWSEFITLERTFAVSSYCHSSTMRHSKYIALKTKDAIVDRFREKTGSRPSIDREYPDLRVFLHLVENRATVYLDMAGEPLTMRKYRIRGGEAPLKETLAAAIVRLAGYDGEQPLIDPMCGSGTIAIEAASMAKNIPPAFLRPVFGFEKWANYGVDQKQCFTDVKADAKRKIVRSNPLIIASDIDRACVEATRKNARKVDVRLKLHQGSVFDMEPTSPPGLIVTNPPYGKRMKLSEDFFDKLSDKLYTMRQHKVAIFTEGGYGKNNPLPLKPSAAYDLYNGDLPCVLFVYEIY